MSVGGCYTDFHIDMGGTSVWYHVLKGQKVNVSSKLMCSPYVSYQQLVENMQRCNCAPMCTVPCFDVPMCTQWPVLYLKLESDLEYRHHLAAVWERQV